MISPTPTARCPRALFVLATCLMAVVSAVPALGEEFTMRSADSTRVADVPSKMMGGAQYVALDALALQFGGGSRLEGRRVQVDLEGQTAIVDLENINVYATGSQFTLASPLISIDNQPYIAVTDVPGFFKQSFGVAVEPGASGEVLEEALLEAEGVTPAVPPVAETPDAVPTEAAPADEPPASTAPVEAGSERLLARRILIDAGHGGYDTGYISPGGVVEKDLALAMAQLLGEELKQKSGLEIFFTRSEDTDASIRDRVQTANEQQADVFISLHAGAAFSPEASGIAVFYPAGLSPQQRGPRAALDAASPTADFSAESGALAEAVAAAIAQDTALSLYAVRPMPLRLFDRAGMPGILVEVGFLSNPKEEQLLSSDGHRARIAAALANGIVAVLRQR